MVKIANHMKFFKEMNIQREIDLKLALSGSLPNKYHTKFQPS